MPNSLATNDASAPRFSSHSEKSSERPAVRRRASWTWKNKRPRRHPLDGLEQGRGRMDPLARVVADQPGFDQVQFQARTAPRNMFQAPQPIFEQVDQRGAERCRRCVPVRIDHGQLFSQHVVAQRGPAPAGQIVGKFVQLEMVLQDAVHHVMLHDRVAGRCGAHSSSSRRLEQLRAVALRRRLQSITQKSSVASMASVLSGSAAVHLLRDSIPSA